MNRALRRAAKKNGRHTPPLVANTDRPNPNMLIGIPSNGDVRIEWSVALRILQEPMNMAWAIRVVTGEAVDVARNVIVKEAQEQGAEWVFFLDDDVLVPPNALQALVHEMTQRPMCDVMTAIVTTRSDPAMPVIFNDPIGEDGRPSKLVGNFWDWKFGDVFEITGCGMAAALCRVSAFEKVGKVPFLDTRLRRTGATESEDRNFIRRLREAGGHVFAHGGILCGHMDRKTGRLYQISPDTKPFEGMDTSRLQRAPG